VHDAHGAIGYSTCAVRDDGFADDTDMQSPRRARARRTPALTHLDARGRARMVDVGEKPETVREAVARAEVRLAAATLRRIAAGALPKGDVFAAARLAGILAAKRTPELIPLCHPLPLTAVEIDIAPDAGARRLRLEARVRLVGRTGAEMEALLAVTVAALTVYDMCKAVDRGMVIERARLVFKAGGKSGTFKRRGERRQRRAGRAG
jgi:cyclic pyranopterin phosphate synthase